MYFVFCQLNYTSRTSLCPLNIDVFLTFSYRYQQVVRKIAFLSFPHSDNAIFICFTGTICFFLPSFTAFLIAYFLLTKLFMLVCIISLFSQQIGKYPTAKCKHSIYSGRGCISAIDTTASHHTFRYRLFFCDRCVERL